MTIKEAIILIECSATELVGALAEAENDSAATRLQRYIDAYDMAISALRAQQEKPFGGWLDVVDVIEREPAVDAVEVVRCKECKWSHTPYTDGFEKIFPGGAFSCRMGRGLNQDPFGERLPNDDSIVSGDDFCSYGERKEGFEDG